MSLYYMQRPTLGERWRTTRPRATRTVVDRTLGGHVVYVKGDRRRGRNYGRQTVDLDHWTRWQAGAKEIDPAPSWEPRTRFIDYDARPEPRTAVYCVKCQKDVVSTVAPIYVRMVPGEPMVLHPEDDRHARPYESFRIGADCARRLGFAWTRKEP